MLGKSQNDSNSSGTSATSTNDIDPNWCKYSKEKSQVLIDYDTWNISPILKELLLGCNDSHSPLRKLRGQTNTILRKIFLMFVSYSDHFSASSASETIFHVHGNI